jgi:hypothetical protein
VEQSEETATEISDDESSSVDDAMLGGVDPSTIVAFNPWD